MRYFIDTPEISQWVEAEWIQGRFWIHLNGKTFVVEDERSKSGRGKRSDTDQASDLTAPMPGKVTKILVKLQQKIKKGEAILVMEAMKMEYTLKAGADGEIKKLNCQVGDQVVIGQLLAELQIAPLKEGGSPQ